MRTIFNVLLITSIFLASCSSSRKIAQPALTDSVMANIDLINVKDDKVTVTIFPPVINSETISFMFPHIIPGTYAIEDYGRYIEGLQAYDRKGKKMTINRTDSNTWVIGNATQLGRITYQVNDTYDIEGGGNNFDENNHDIFSPAGTNILAGKNFVLNLCGFVGYFSDKLESPYSIKIAHPSNLYGATSMTDADAATDVDLFTARRYADVVDCPIMYSEPDLARFTVQDMDVVLSVYSPRNKHVTAAALEPELKKMVLAQKKFLGDLSTTKKYAILAYLTDLSKNNAQGIGALEHNASTTGTFRDNMTSEDLVHVISHEFFHTVTPLKMHSKEIHYFDFAKPEMSQHLWFYEGVTEYFAQYFQANQGLIEENQFLDKMASKIVNARTRYNDSMSFTYMSKHILDPKVKEQYPNVYEKGATIGMCLDILLRKTSNGQKGLIDLMRELSQTFGADKPFEDDEFIAIVTRMTNPEIGRFLQDHVVNGKPIDYDYYFGLVGIEKAVVPFPEPIVFIHDQKPYIIIDTSKKKVYAMMPDEENAFMTGMGLKKGDVLVSMNDQPFDATSLMSTMVMGYNLLADSPMTMKIIRDGKLMELKGKVKINYVDGPGYRFKDESKKALKDAWLKG